MNEEKFFDDNLVMKKLENSLHAEILTSFDQKVLDEILDLEKKCFDESWQFEDSSSYYRELLEDKKNINAVLKEGKKIVGYTVAVPFRKAFEELVEHDPELKLDEKRYYFETIQILEEHRLKGGVSKMINAVCDEGKRRNIFDFAGHARISNNLNLVVKKIIGNKITSNRFIKSWPFGGDEPYEYIEWSNERK